MTNNVISALLAMLTTLGLYYACGHFYNEWMTHPELFIVYGINFLITERL
jgi:hypothetical protein